MEKIRIRGLALIASYGIGAWGALIALKGLYDVFIGEPEANLYAPRKWAFVTQEQWTRWSGFELVYGLSCLALAYAAYRYARFLPEWVERPKREQELGLFD